MAKVSGIPYSVTIDESDGNARDISNDITSVQFNSSQGLQDVTGLDKLAIERLGLLRDAELVLTGVFNAASNMSHEVFKDYYTPVSGAAGRTVALGIASQTLSMDMIIESYSQNRGSDGSLIWTSTLRLDSGTTPAWS